MQCGTSNKWMLQMPRDTSDDTHSRQIEKIDRHVHPLNYHSTSHSPHLQRRRTRRAITDQMDRRSAIYKRSITALTVAGFLTTELLHEG